jgi:hypothetical protein
MHPFFASLAVKNFTAKGAKVYAKGAKKRANHKT